MADLLQTDASGLNKYAAQHKSIYPIAARCGVFAKTDIQPLISEGATREDLAASIFQAVVNQTISGLACGKPIRGHVAFLGGPLHFLDQLRARFIETLRLDEEHAIIPDNSHLFAACGAAMESVNAAKSEARTAEVRYVDGMEKQTLGSLVKRLSDGIKMEFEVSRLAPLFADIASYKEFK